LFSVDRTCTHMQQTWHKPQPTQVEVEPVAFVELSKPRPILSGMYVQYELRQFKSTVFRAWNCLSLYVRLAV